MVLVGINTSIDRGQGRRSIHLDGQKVFCPFAHSSGGVSSVYIRETERSFDAKPNQKDER